MAKRNRVYAALLAAIFVLVVLSSSIFIIEHADHDCTGEDCPICEQLFACAQNLKRLTNAAAAVVVAVALVILPRAVIRRLAAVYVFGSPIALKVKLSN